MTTKNVLQPINGNQIAKSPARKRARYESPRNRWSMIQNDIVLDEVFDYGVSVLADSESECASDEDNFTSNGKGEQMAVLQSVLSQEALRKITLEDWDGFIINRSEFADITLMNPFDQLSDEIILHIFQFLPKRVLSSVALVCKRWHRLTQDDCLWSRMDLAYRHLEPGALGHILSRQVIILRLSQADILYPPIQPDCRAFCEDFRSRLLLLDLSMAHVSCESLVELFKRCRRLKKVSLEHVPVNDDVLSALSLSKDLEVINFAMAEGIQLQGLKCLLDNCCSIRELNFAWTYLSAESVEYVCSNLPETLDRLNLSGCRKLITNAQVIELVNHCKGLRELDLSDCTSLTGEAITAITSLDKLNCLALSRCYQVSYRSLLQLKRMPSLMYLDVHGGYVEPAEMRRLVEGLGSHIELNKFKFSSVARPTVGTKRSSIWSVRVRD